MKYLYQISSSTLIAFLIISVGLNYFLWTEIRIQEVFIDNASNDLVYSNDLLAEKIYNQHEFSKNTDHTGFHEPRYSEIENLRAKYQVETTRELNGAQRYDVEKSRKEQLERNHFRSNAKFLMPKRIITKLSNQDSLYVGYTKNRFQDSKYELKVNDQPQDFILGNRYSFPKDSIYKLEMKKITISDDGQSIDTVKAIRILNKV